MNPKPIRHASAAPRVAATFIAAAMVAAPSLAGVKYWDDHAFRAYDIGDYVQDGLVVNYDGILNAGPDAAHDPAATTWVNCANPGTYNMTRYSFDGSAWAAGAAAGSWTDDGFVFAKDAVFHESTSFTVPSRYTIQTLVDATAAAQNGIGYLLCDYNANNWNKCSLCIRSSGFWRHGVDNTCCFTVHSDHRPAFQAGSFSYATAMLDETDGVVFAGTEAPWTASTDSYGRYGHSTLPSAQSAVTFADGYSIGGHYPKTDELFSGTLKSYRFYDRVLSDEEVAWNRVVDEARYFDRRAAIPVTNIVLSTTIPGSEDGHFALDAEGYTFSAPASRTVKGRRYVLSGYTLETWDGSAWGSPAVHDGETSCTLSDTTAKVRLTWRYARPEGEGRLVVYDIDDYVQDGLLLHYDGIRNAGATAAHDPEALQWRNIAPGYENRWPMDRCSYVDSGSGYAPVRNDATEGAWTDNGFAFTGKGYFAKWDDGDPFSVPTNFTMQVSVTGAIADQHGNVAYLWVPGSGWDKGGIGMRKTNYDAAHGNANSVYYVNNALFAGGARPNFYPAATKPSYVTAIMDHDDTGHTYIFEGTSRPAGGGNDAPSIAGASAATDLTWFSAGGFHGKSVAAVADLECFKGTLHNLRFYNRALTDAEVAQNRTVDEFRFFGRLAETNVVVRSSFSFLEGCDKCGVYDVDGSYTFVAPESVTAANGITYAPDGYTIETWDGSAWGAPVAHDGASYAYTTSAGLVRLTWKWRATHGIRTAADYDIGDYVQDGLVVNYDGILNAGPDAAHDPAATTWVNCANPGTYNMTRYSFDGSAWAAGAAAGSWTDDGFVFAKDAVFHESTSFTVPSRYTIQTLVDATAAAQNGIGYLLCDYNANNWNKCSLCIRSSGFWRHGVDNTCCFTVHSDHRPAFQAGSFSYATAMLDETDGVVFAGTEAPWTASTDSYGRYGHSTLPSAQSAVTFADGYSIGGHYPKTDELFSGTLKSYRFYDRVLSDAEVAHNRQVDSARFFGALATTNVVVAVEDCSRITAAETAGEAYFVEGEYTFTAAGCAGLGYRLSVPDGNGGWRTLQGFTEGGSYTYATGTSPALVKLEWRLPRPFLMIVR